MRATTVNSKKLDRPNFFFVLFCLFFPQKHKSNIVWGNESLSHSLTHKSSLNHPHADTRKKTHICYMDPSQRWINVPFWLLPQTGRDWHGRPGNQPRFPWWLIRWVLTVGFMKTDDWLVVHFLLYGAGGPLGQRDPLPSETDRPSAGHLARVQLSMKMQISNEIKRYPMPADKFSSRFIFMQFSETLACVLGNTHVLLHL